MLFQRVISRQREPSAYQGGTLVSIGLHTVLLGAVGWHIGAGLALAAVIALLAALLGHLKARETS